MAYVADVGDQHRTPNIETNGRLRVVYANGTESDLLMRSLQRALYKDGTGRRLTDPDMANGAPGERHASPLTAPCKVGRCAPVATLLRPYCDPTAAAPPI